MPRGAGVAELADALDSKSGSRKGVGVRAPPPVPNSTHHPPIERSGIPDLAMAQEIMRRVIIHESSRQAGQSPNSPSKCS